MAAQKDYSASDAPYVVDARVRIGHVHLKVADLQRALRFYAGVLGMEVMQRYGDGAVFLSAGGYHHHIALNTWESLGGSPPRRDFIIRRLFIRRERR
jgi:catechol 2,3-dioxygenase